MSMKNKFLILLTSIFLFFNDSAFAKDFIFKTKNLEIIDDGKLIFGGKGKAVSTDGDLEINADKLLDIRLKFGFKYSSITYHHG